jgi:hypothetical protein
MENNKAFTLTNDGKNSFFLLLPEVLGKSSLIKKKRLIVNHLKIKAL